ncbi:hypothetical protein KIH87_03430 [Paraneptunicella aestuarii]|uniref:hypothetical protein n=1 Tax=Paraneptunicella aestuarii TaxID=2831148 RepID=UPI001E5D8C4E|nr:hypothetical protein [Paraneptunicella aestuarii]UAA39421.1 hypothetical protein KIH87_03430 [Paraneptunicella aestuarii]
MIVTQSDYMSWQQMYGQAAAGKSGTSTDTKTDAIGGQALATSAEQSGNDVVDIQSEKDFLQVAFEKTLNHRLGIDQEKMEEIKEEIEKTEQAIEALNKTKPLSETQKKELNLLEERLEKLQQALEELVKQAAERSNGSENKNSQANLNSQSNKQLAQYQSVFALL